AEDGIRDRTVTGVQTCALPISDRDEAGAGLPGLVDGQLHRRGSRDRPEAVLAVDDGCGRLLVDDLGRGLGVDVAALESAGVAVRSEERRVGRGGTSWLEPGAVE